jgi:hypothetical protein
MCLRPQDTLETAVAALSDADLDRLYDTVAAEERKRWGQRREQRVTAATQFKKVGAPVGLMTLLALPLAGCAVDVSKLARDLSKPSVSFEQPTAWNCDQTTKLPTKEGISECGVCRNRSQDIQAITVNKARQGVNPGQAVFLCLTTVVVEGQPTP